MKPSFPRRAGPDLGNEGQLRVHRVFMTEMDLPSHALCPTFMCLMHLLAKPIPQFLRIEAGEICELELFASQSGITTPPSDELRANESEPDGQIFLKTACLRSGGEGEKFLAKLLKMFGSIRCM